MTEYTPSDADARMIYHRGMKTQRPYVSPADAHSEFDRFLARVRREAAREALDGLAEHIDSRSSWLAGTEMHSPKARDVLAYRDTHYPETEDQT